jgi:hypothetical protein
MKGNGAVEDEKLASASFNHATDETISMSFEGDLYEVLNYRNESLANVFIPRFTKLLDSYGLLYELGDEWNLGTYYRDAPEEEVKERGTCKDNPIYIKQPTCPPLLEEIRALWEKRQNEYGDVGCAISGAGFAFKFIDKYFFMPPQGMCQGNVSWEDSVDTIKQLLIDAGCEDVVFHDGVMD